MHKGSSEGTRYLEFVTCGVMNGALDLIQKGYAQKIKTGPDDSNYTLTDKGTKYLKRVLAFASEEFYKE